MIRRRAASVVLTASLTLGTGALAVVPITTADAVGAPVVIDDFGGNRVGPRTVTVLPEPGTSTTAPAVFTESGGLATLTANGNGNGVGGVRLDYALDDVDLTSEGNNTQFFLEFGGIQRLPVQQLGELGASITIRVTDTDGVTGSYNTGISNIIGFNVVLNFACAAGPPCFDPQPDWTHIAGVTVEIRYPVNFDEVGNLTAVLDVIRTTPTGGIAPPAPTPIVSVPSEDVFGPLGSTSVTFDVAFRSVGEPAAVTHDPPSDIGLRAQDVVVRGTAAGRQNVTVSGGPATYQVTLGPLTSEGTVGVDIPEAVVTDAWGQDNLESSSTPTVHYRIPIPPVLSATGPTPFIIGQAKAFQFISTGLPAPTFETDDPLPAGLTLDEDGALSGTPAAGTSGLRTITVTATNIGGSNSRDYTLTVFEVPAFTNPDSASLVAGAEGDFTVSYGGFPTADLDVQGLPAWLSVTENGDGTATFSGTPPGTAVGSTQLTLTAENDAGDDEQVFTIEVTPVQTTLNAEPDDDPLVYGQPVTVTATVTAEDDVSGSIQFRIDGEDFGEPVTVSDGEATSPPLTAPGGGSLPAGSYEVTAEFLPDDPEAVTSASDTFTLVISKADTATSVEVRPAAVVVDVTALAAGAGTPTGAVTIAVDGEDVGEAPLVDGTAELPYEVPGGQEHSVSAVYPGDANFTASSASTLRSDPVITASVKSTRPASAFGWYRSPVQVAFDCVAGSAPLVRPCPDDVTVDGNHADRVIERTVRASDGGIATVVQHVSIDQRDPRVHVDGVRDGAVYMGHAPRATCVAADALAGIETCDVTLKPVGDRIRFKAEAMDKAGNSSVVRGRYKVLPFFVLDAPFRDRTFVVRTGRVYPLVARSKDRPRYFYATPAPTTPFERGPLMRKVGKDRWALPITITPELRVHERWNVGIKTGGELHVVRLRIR